MERKMFSVLLVLFFVIGISSITISEMSSANYSIPTSVLSGGGAPISSNNYQTNSTLGQSSLLISGGRIAFNKKGKATRMQDHLALHSFISVITDSFVTGISNLTFSQISKNPPELIYWYPCK